MPAAIAPVRPAPLSTPGAALMPRLAESPPQGWEVGAEPPGNVYDRARIQSCNACV
jgi:hypothetical protein